MQFPEQWDNPEDIHQEIAPSDKKRRKRRIETSCQTRPQFLDVPEIGQTVSNENEKTLISTNALPDIKPHDIINLQDREDTLKCEEDDCTPIHLSLHSLISRVPFKEMMQQMFSDDMDSAIVVPIVTKAYEESFLREPMLSHENPCVCGDNCEFNFIDPMHPFVGVEFRLQQVDELGPTMCVLCSRKLTQELFYKMVYSGERFLGFIQRYGNLCQQSGEYAREAVLVCPKEGPVCNMPLPIVSHQRHRYSVFMQHGVKYLKQHNVAYEDFQTASSSMP